MMDTQSIVREDAAVHAVMRGDGQQMIQNIARERLELIYLVQRLIASRMLHHHPIVSSINESFSTLFDNTIVIVPAN